MYESMVVGYIYIYIPEYESVLYSLSLYKQNLCQGQSDQSGPLMTDQCKSDFFIDGTAF